MILKKNLLIMIILKHYQVLENIIKIKKLFAILMKL